MKNKIFPFASKRNKKYTGISHGEHEKNIINRRNIEEISKTISGCINLEHNDVTDNDFDEISLNEIVDETELLHPPDSTAEKEQVMNKFEEPYLQCKEFQEESIEHEEQSYDDGNTQEFQNDDNHSMYTLLREGNYQGNKLKVVLHFN